MNRGFIPRSELPNSVKANTNGSMLGDGIYAAPDPRKAWQYTDGFKIDNKDAYDERLNSGSLMFVCRFKPNTSAKTRQNKVYREYMVSNRHDICVLWMLLVKVTND